MNRILYCCRLAAVSVFALFLGGSGLLAEKGEKGKFKLPLKVGEKAVAYIIDSNESFSFDRNGETNTTKSSVKGKITVVSKGENQIVVSVKRLVVKGEGFRGDVNFDLKKAGEDESEAVAAVRKFLSEPVKVTIEEGRASIARPEIDREAEGARAASTVIDSLRSNISRILGSGLHGQELVVGQVYGSRGRGDARGRGGQGGRGQGGRRRRPGGDEEIRLDGETQISLQEEGQEDRPRRRRGQGQGDQGRQGRGQSRRGGSFFRGFGGGTSYRFEGVSDGDHGKIAKFTLVTQTRSFRDRDAEPTTTEVGEAVFNATDGMLISLKTESKSASGEDSRFSFKRESRATVTRAGAAKKNKGGKKKADL